MRSLITRIERLEAQRPKAITRAHRVIQQIGEAYASARARYELESGCEIGPDDFVVVRKIIDSTDERAA